MITRKLDLHALLLILLDISVVNTEDLSYPTSQPVKKLQPSDKEQSTLDLPRSESENGCTCWQISSKRTVCLGSNTCQKFPLSFKIQTSSLKIKTTQILEIKQGDLTTLTHLQCLELEANAYLEKLESGSFSNMSNLKNMSISYNPNLKVLEEGVFEGLVSLEELLLIKNGFTRILDVTLALQFKFLPKLLKLNLNENQFIEIEKHAFKHMNCSCLQQLKLILCQTEFIHPKSLTTLKNLRYLHLGGNNIKTSNIVELIKTSIKWGVPLNKLDLYGSGFKKPLSRDLLKAVANSNITHLCIGRNQFEMIMDDTFLEMPRLEYLDLHDVLAFNITPRAFVKMPRLKTLLLSKNRLSGIPDGVLLEQIIHLDLSWNSGNNYSPHFSLEENKFYKMKHLKSLNLSFNKINFIFRKTFAGLFDLRVLDLRNATIFYIQAGSFEQLNKLITLNLENNGFAFSEPLTSELFRGLDSLETLHLGGCMISSLLVDPPAFFYLKNLKFLGLERNKILTISAPIFSTLPALEQIDLSDNYIVPWKEEVFTENRKLISFAGRNNKFSYLSDAMIIDFANLIRLDLSDNPFACECWAFLPLQRWVQMQRINLNIVDSIGNYPPYCVFPENTADLTIGDYFFLLQNKTVTCDVPRISEAFVVPLTILTIIFSVLAITVYFCRWHLKYLLFLIRLRLGRKSAPVPKRSEIIRCIQYQYDAFVSYSSADRDFIVKLVAMLENCEPYLNLCLFERDFQIGAFISEEVLENLQKSRKILLVVSNTYAKSQWCRWEAQIAEYHSSFEHSFDGGHFNNSLILIKLGNVSCSHMSSTLKYLLKTKIYLQWDPDPTKQKAFWDKLRKVLSSPTE